MSNDILQLLATMASKAIREYNIAHGAIGDLLNLRLLSPSKLPPLPPNAHDKFVESINSRRGKPVYAKSILTLTPDDIKNATSLHVVRTDIDPRAEYAGWTKHTLLGTDKFDPCPIDIHEDYYFTARHSRDINTIVRWITYGLVHISAYYVMNAQNEDEVMSCIDKYAKYVRETNPDPSWTRDPFKRQVTVRDVEERIRSSGWMGGRRKSNRNRRRKIKTKRRN